MNGLVLEVIRKLVKKGTYQPLNTIEISSKNLISNYRYLQSINPKVKIAPVLKSNAYGHGLILVAKLLDHLKCPFFCVDSIYEAYELLKVNINTPILIMGYIEPGNLSVKPLPFSYAIFDLKMLQAVAKYQPHAGIHLFVDSGMNREGILTEQLPIYLNQIKRMLQVKVEGLMSHLASAEVPKSSNTKAQVNNFWHIQKIVREHAIRPKWVHLIATKAILHHKYFPKFDKFSNMARVGMGLFGIDPVGINKTLKPVLQLKTKLVQIKKIKKGEFVGYSGAYKAKSDMTLGILPIGYFDGVDRRLSNKGFVTIDGVACTIIGLVSMNITTVDISAIQNLTIGQEVFLYSQIRSDPNSIENAAKICKTIPYEILIHLSPTTRRVVV